MHYVAQAAGRADGHDDIVLVVFGAEARVERVGDGLSDLGITGVGRIAMDIHRVLVGDDIYYSVFHGLRGSEVGVADGEVKYVLRTVFLGETLAFLKHGADGAAARGHFGHSLRNHFPFLLNPE